jgi:hypothetical protein
MVVMVSNQRILLSVTAEASLAKGFSDEPRYNFTIDQDGSPDDRWTDLSTSALLCGNRCACRIDESCTQRAFVPAESDPTKQGLSKSEGQSTFDMPADCHSRSEIRDVAVPARSFFLAAQDIKD